MREPNEKKAAAKVVDLLARPQTENTECGPCDHEFDPWCLLPALYGSYSSEFDKLAIDVLSDIANKTHLRNDLASEMFREMLCKAGLCKYGMSPRSCWATTEFKILLPQLIERWRAYAEQQWSN